MNAMTFPFSSEGHQKRHFFLVNRPFLFASVVSVKVRFFFSLSLSHPYFPLNKLLADCRPVLFHRLPVQFFFASVPRTVQAHHCCYKKFYTQPSLTDFHSPSKLPPFLFSTTPTRAFLSSPHLTSPLPILFLLLSCLLTFVRPPSF